MGGDGDGSGDLTERVDPVGHGELIAHAFTFHQLVPRSSAQRWVASQLMVSPKLNH